MESGKVIAKKPQLGFTWMELLVALTIVVLLGIIAIPSYMRYMKKTYYDEVIQTANRYKVAVTACLKQRAGKLSDCDGGRYGIPPNIVAGSGVGQVDRVTVVNGVITVTPKANNGIAATDTYILAPIFSVRTGSIQWVRKGGACQNGLVPGC